MLCNDEIVQILDYVPKKKYKINKHFQEEYINYLFY